MCLNFELMIHASVIIHHVNFEVKKWWLMD